MKTLHLKVDPDDLQGAAAREAIARAAAILRNGGLVALPTETVYGLGANALDAQAVSRIFSAKQRPSWDPVIVHIAGPVDENPMLRDLVTDMPAPARKLMHAFWPGPLTLLLPRSSSVPDEVTAGRPLVGIRMPAHPVALELIRQAGVPIAAPSANKFSHTSPTTAEHVLADLEGRIDAILDAGPAAHGVESTVLDPGQSPIMIYRPGAVTLEQVLSVAGNAELFREDGSLHETPREALPSPGVGLRHYAPHARLILVEAQPSELASKLTELAGSFSGEKLGVMVPAELAPLAIPGSVVFRWGSLERPEELAHRLYAGLRELDSKGCAVILCPMPPNAGIGTALRDRLHKAAWKTVKS